MFQQATTPSHLHFSTAVSIMLDVIETSFADRYAAAWKKKIVDLIPSRGVKLADNQKLLDEVNTFTRETLQLDA